MSCCHMSMMARWYIVYDGVLLSYQQMNIKALLLESRD